MRISRQQVTRNATLDPGQTTGNGTRQAPSIVAEENQLRESSRVHGGTSGSNENALSVISKRFEAYPSSVWVRAIASFGTHFPEYGYNHPTELKWSSDQTSDHHKLKMMAMLVVTARYLPQGVIDDSTEQRRFVVTELQSRLTETPSLALVQAYHLVGVLEWGEGNTYAAWIYVGIAIRMLQSLLSTKDSTHVAPPQVSQTPARQVAELESRTYWSCALLDKQVSNGRNRSNILPPAGVEVPFPTSDDVFILGLMSAPASAANLLTQDGCIDYAVLGMAEIQKPLFMRMIPIGMSIWSKIHRWVALGGRKQSGMVDPLNSPWRGTSQWAMMRAELQLWRDAHHPQYRFPETTVMAHKHLHQAEAFVHLNLIYHLR